MKDFCLDEGTLQGYLDGELSPDMMEAVAGHLAACEACTSMVGEAESELAIFNAAFAPEMSLHIPSEQLRARLNATIEELQTPSQPFRLKEESRFRSWLSGLAASFAFTPQRAAFAGLAVAVALAVVFSAVYSRRGPVNTNNEEIASSKVNTGPEQVKTGGTAIPVETGSQVKPLEDENERTTARPVQVVHRPQRRPALTSSPKRLMESEATPGSSSDTPNLAQVKTEELLPGEKSYLKTIAALSTVVEASGDTILKPTLRAEYERNLAVVDQAIAAARPVARSKPNNPDAARFLFAAYQSKVDLLSSVADQQTQFVAIR